MPSYEVALIVKKIIERSHMKSVLEGACTGIFKQGGLIKKMENLGYRELPHPIRNRKQTHTRGNYFAIQFDSSVEGMQQIETDYKNTKEIIHFGIIKHEEEPRRPCLDGPCHFGELPNPEHEKTAYKRRVLKQMKNKHVSNV